MTRSHTLLSTHNARLAAARRLTTRRARRETGRLLAEGAQAVREAVRAGAVVEVFATAAARERHADLLDGAAFAVDEISERDAAALSETVTPQGLVAVCELTQPTLLEVIAKRPRLLAALHEPNDPGNLGTIVRTADAAGADAVLLVGGADPYNGKAVRAGAGSLFHLPVVTISEGELASTAGGTLMSCATSGTGEHDLDALLDDGALSGPTLWIFGTEAHGLPDAVLRAADRRVRIPIHGAAESLNVAAAAAVCLYASARAQR